MNRGVGYCDNIDCEEYLKGVFLLHQNVFHCPRCRKLGFPEMEKYEYSNDFPVIREVRVQFNFDPLNRRYTQIAIACDDELGPHCNTLTVCNPLCKTEKRALKLAGLYFAYVSLNGVGAKNINSQENVINLDDSREIVSMQCAKIAKMWEEAAAIRKKGLPNAR